MNPRILIGVGLAALAWPPSALAHSEGMLFIPLLQMGAAGGALVGAVAGAFREKKRVTLLPALLGSLVVLGIAGGVWAGDIRILPYAIAYGALAAAPAFALFFVLCKELVWRATAAIRNADRAGDCSHPGKQP